MWRFTGCSVLYTRESNQIHREIYESGLKSSVVLNSVLNLRTKYGHQDWLETPSDQFLVRSWNNGERCKQAFNKYTKTLESAHVTREYQRENHR